MGDQQINILEPFNSFFGAISFSDTRKDKHSVRILLYTDASYSISVKWSDSGLEGPCTGEHLLLQGFLVEHSLFCYLSCGRGPVGSFLCYCRGSGFSYRTGSGFSIKT